MLAATLSCVLGAAGSAHAAPDVGLSHVGTFSVPTNLPADEAKTAITSAEIVDVSSDGQTLLYTDSLSGHIGFVDIRDPSKPLPAGILDPGGEPTSLAVVGPWALVAVNTSKDPDGDGPYNEFDAPSGELVVIEIESRNVVRRIPLLGQPDSVAISPDQHYAAVVIENERDEDENEGLIPQWPAGALQVLDLLDQPDTWITYTVELTGLAEIAPEDPEPEFVDINTRNQAVVSLQENNHLVIVDLPTHQVVKHFSAGSVTLQGIDATEEALGPQETGLIQFKETITRRREPDAVAWIDDDTFATANEGDYTDENGEEGGSRSFTLWNIDGTVEYEAGASFEYELARAGHYNEARSADKGSEPEGLEVATFGERRVLLVGSERANAVAVYDVTSGKPEFLHVLPTGIGPEGLKAIADRNLLAVSAEVDGLDEGFAIRPIVTLYAWKQEAPSYPQIVSADVAGAPIPWVALSGLSGDTQDTNVLWGISDAALAQAYVYRIDASQKPAVITQRIAVGAADGALDLEGIAKRPEGGFWLASEGLATGRPNKLVRADDAGNILSVIELPPALAANGTASGFEGVAVTGSEAAGDEIVWVAVQREWKDDPAGFVKIGRYEVAQATWTFARYPLGAVESPAGGWVGLSEITAFPNGQLVVVERDNQLAEDARIKRLYSIDPNSVTFAPYGSELPTLEKTLYQDVLQALDAHSISVPDKLESVGLTLDGRVFLATDNDGLDSNYGESLFFELGTLASL